MATTHWAESKDEGKGKVKEATLKPRAAKTVPTTSMSNDSMALLSKIIQNQETILHRETLKRLSPGGMSAFSTFPANLFVGDYAKPISPIAQSSTHSGATVSLLPAHDDTAKTNTLPGSEEIPKKKPVTTPIDSANSPTTFEPLKIVKEVL
ncbi:hypothetical protein V6N11_013849 [Hibiscus sabdariffa]|uniref:Uncharacterized protein n=1 Tax=Hibiscus sabdariffa TaxID=183260 RepID=A0ABR2N9Y8_9ROSI